MYGKIFKIKFFKNMQLFDVKFIYIIIVKLGDIVNNALEYFWIVMDLMWQKVTLPLGFIVKCMKLYIL